MERPDRNVRLNFLVYGLTGVGKTRLLGSAEKCNYTSPMFYIAIEGGTWSISNTIEEVFRPQSFGEIQDAYNFLRFENTRFKSVGIDSLTEGHDKLSMGEILGVLKDDSSYDNLDEHVPATQWDWLQSGEQMRRFIRAFRDLAYLPDPKRRVHVFMTALEKTDEKRQIVCPALPGALALGVGASVDVLARLTKERVEKEDRTVIRRLLTTEEMETDEGYKALAKARTPEGVKFPNAIWQPTVEKMISYWSTNKEANEN